MRIMKMLVGLLALLGTQAQGANLYVGAGLGASMALNADSSINDARGVLAKAGATTHINYDKVAPAPTVLLGIDVTKYLAGELQYTYLGNYQLNASLAGGGTAKETDNVHAWSFSAVGKYWVGSKFHLLGKLGFSESVVDMGCSIPGGRCGSGTDSAVGFVFGVGLALVPARELELRLDYTQYANIGNKRRDYAAGPFGMIEGLAIYHF